MKDRYCYWTVTDGEYTDMAQALVHSARKAGVFKDFHIWSDHPVDEAICHSCGAFEKVGWLFKLVYLREQVAKLNYDYFVWLDADNYFVRNPGNLLSVMQGSPVHVT